MTKFIDDSLKRPGRLTQKVNIPTLYDMIHGAREEVIDAMIAMIKEHEKVHEVFCQVMKNRSPGKEVFNIVHPDWIKWSNKNSKMMETYADPSPRGWAAASKMVEDMQPAINNHVCPHCKNERVNKTEKSCWLCGGLL